MDTKPIEEPIRQRDFDIHEARERQAGAEMDDLITTERELTPQRNTEKQNTSAPK
jgi:hypothetical protein